MVLATPTTFKRQPDGATEVDYVVVRDGKNLKGRLLGVVLGTVGKGRLKGAFEKAVKAIEARNDGAGAAQAGGEIEDQRKEEKRNSSFGSRVLNPGNFERRSIPTTPLPVKF